MAPNPTRPRVIIIGGGFGGLYAARQLKHAPVDVTVIDRTNHHVFQPLLYQVATAMLSPADIAAPIRWLLRNQANTEVLLGDVTAVDPAAHAIATGDSKKYNYDYLIIAAGARHSYFGHDDWERLAPGLKSIDDATELRRRWLMAFERAERTDDAAERAANLTFVIIGGGPTGVELAGMLPTIARQALPRDFRRIDTASARIVLVEGGPRILPAMPEELSEAARRDLVELGVEVRTNTLVTDVGDGFVKMGDERLDSHTIFWAAGNAAAALGASLGAPCDRAGRVLVNADLSVPGHPEIFVVGDLAAMTSRGKPVPGVAPAAMQSGRTAARNVVHAIRREPRESFRYRNKGDLATIGRYRAVGVLAGRNLSGPVAWWTWLLVHIMYLAGFRNRISVLIEWGYSFFTYQRGARLITTGSPAPAARGTLPPAW
ncbi:MAG TPA: NAD(P)/FAD-dependent oxidoreductase [Gemmatimonadaceae bacterium]|nr:NAD(P)/FAD-dependent oxidoreductase [Gemmatimonadaceae bacterium]